VLFAEFMMHDKEPATGRRPPESQEDGFVNNVILNAVKNLFFCWMTIAG
jgi:hypothetical protein